MQKIILFDIDGTLLLTGGAGKAAFDQVFLTHFNIAGAWRDIHPDGRTDPFLIDELFQKNLSRLPTQLERESVAKAYAEAMELTLKTAPNFRLMPGVSEFLKSLREEGSCLLGLATGNFEVTAFQKLRRAGLSDFFSFGGFGSDDPERLELTRVARERGFEKLGKSLPSRDVILIGDTVHDIDCGKRLGMTTVAVATGSTPKEELATMHPDFLFQDLDSCGELQEAITGTKRICRPF